MSTFTFQFASVIVSYVSEPDAIVIVTVVRSGSLFETDCPVCVLAYLHPPRSIATTYSLSYNRSRLYFSGLKSVI